MPTRPSPDSPYLASRLQADMGVRTPGTPSMAGKAGGVQAADVSFPAPPAPAAAPVGRPPEPGTPAPAAPPATPAAPVAQPAGGPQPAGAASPAQPAAAPLGTPIGPNAAGDQQFALSPEGGLRYQQAVVEKRTRLGPLPSVFRNSALPQMPVEPGRHDFNPFTGQWAK